MTERAQTLIFDFDGVLVDSEPAHYRAFQAVLEPQGLGYSWQSYCAHFIGFDDREGFREAYRAGGQELSEERLASLVQAKHAAFEQEMAAGLAPVPRAIECVWRLAQVVPLAVCSGALRNEIEPTLAQLGIAEAFRVIVTAEDVAVSKPDPAGYRLALARLGRALGTSLEPGASVAVEDTPAGVASAREAGLWVIGLDVHGANALGEAHWVVSSLDRIPPQGLQLA